MKSCSEHLFPWFNFKFKPNGIEFICFRGYTNATLHGSTNLQLDPNTSYVGGGPYPFGLDPVSIKQ